MRLFRRNKCEQVIDPELTALREPVDPDSTANAGNPVDPDSISVSDSIAAASIVSRAGSLGGATPKSVKKLGKSLFTGCQFSCCINLEMDILVRLFFLPRFSGIH